MKIVSGSSQNCFFIPNARIGVRRRFGQVEFCMFSSIRIVTGEWTISNN